MVFTNANKHSYQLQNDSAAAGIEAVFHSPEGRSARSTAQPPSFPPLIQQPPSLTYRLFHCSSSSSSSSSYLPPLVPANLPSLSTRRRRTFDHPHSRVISRTIVPSSGLRKYLTLESRERKGRGLSTSKQTERMTSSRLRWKRKSLDKRTRRPWIGGTKEYGWMREGCVGCKKGRRSR